MSWVVEPRETSFKRPPEFDALTFVQESLASTPGIWPVQVLLETTIEAARRSIPSWQAILEPNPDGVVMRLEAENLDWLARLLAGLGCPFVVREPPELREAVRRLGETLLGSAQRGPA